MTDVTAVHAPPNSEAVPLGELCTRTLAMPADTNQNGDIFGGWLLSQMDVGGGVFASKVARSRTVTVATTWPSSISGMWRKLPVPILLSATAIVSASRRITGSGVMTSPTRDSSMPSRPATGTTRSCVTTGATVSRP